MRLVTLALGLVLVLVGSAAGDILHLYDGRTIEGEIIHQDDEKVEIKMPLGIVTVKRDRIERIEFKASPAQLYRQRLASLEPEDWKGLGELAEWCRENGLPSYARELEGRSRRLRYEVGLKHIEHSDADALVGFAQTLRKEGWEQEELVGILEMALLAEPDHREARRLLGYTLFEGRWLTDDQIREIEEVRHARAMRAKGFVKYKGEWMPAETKLLQIELDKVADRERQVADREDRVERKAQEVERERDRVEGLAKRVERLAEELAEKQRELAKREDDLDAREADLAAREAYLSSRLQALYYYEQQLRRLYDEMNRSHVCPKCGNAVPRPSLPSFPRSQLTPPK